MFWRTMNGRPKEIQLPSTSGKEGNDEGYQEAHAASTTSVSMIRMAQALRGGANNSSMPTETRLFTQPGSRNR